MSLDELSREGSFLDSEDFRVGMNLFARGALMAAEMDDFIREQTHNQKSLRDALRHLLDWSAQNHRAFRTERTPPNLSAMPPASTPPPSSIAPCSPSQRNFRSTKSL